VEIDKDDPFLQYVLIGWVTMIEYMFADGASFGNNTCITYMLLISMDIPDRVMELHGG
jgi:hypothetical protein